MNKSLKFRGKNMQNISTFSIRERIAEAFAPSLKERRNLLEREANTDALTGLANRAAFDKAKGRARRDGAAFIVFDMNNFGRVNKLHGFAVGDASLKYYSYVIANVAANFKARAFRLGGDEFVIICTARFAFQIRDSVERRAAPQWFEGFTVSISGEVGHSVEDADSRLQARKAARKSEV
jgi:diguanylate cyclase (GGDEF)-like protein